MRIGKRIYSVVVLLFLASFLNVHAQEEVELSDTLTYCDSLYMASELYMDSLIEAGVYSKTSQELNGYINDRFFGYLDTALNCKYEFIDFGKNHFQFHSENSPSFEALYQKLQNMVKYKNEKLNFYHIGGSHIQADIYSNIIRRELQSYWEGIPGQRGFVFPFKMAKTNNPWNYSFESSNTWTGYRSVIHRPDSVHYGVLGVAIACSDSLIDLKYKYAKEHTHTPIDHVRIYHHKGKLGYEIRYDSIKNPVLIQKTNENLGYTDTYFTKEVTEFDIEFVRLADTISRIDEEGNIIIDTLPGSPLYIYGLHLANKHPGISYTSIGVNGAGLYTYRDNENFQEQMAFEKPDLVIFSVGTNDANVPYDKFKPEEFEANLEGMMKKIYQINPNAAILLTVPNDAFYKRRYLNRNVAREREVIEKLAEKYQIPVWDFYGMMGGLGSAQKWRQNKLMKTDLVHFTRDGYYLKGDMFVEAFLKWIEQMELRPQYSLLKKEE